MDEEAIQDLYAWIDEISLSRPKRNIARDFSDGVLAAEIVASFIPSIVDLHNYTPANSSQQKRTNWDTLNRKAFKKIDFNVPSNIVTGIIACKPGVIEIVLYNLRVKILNYLNKDEGSEELGTNNNVQYGQPYTVPQQHPPMDQIPHMGQPPLHMGNLHGHMMHPIHGHMTEMSPHIRQPYYAAGQNQGLSPQIQYQPSPQKKANRIINPQLNGGNRIIPVDQDQFSVRKKKIAKKKKASSTTSAKEAPRSHSLPSSLLHLDHESRIYLQEKEQALMESQETVQILKSKINRLEHLIHLKDLRIEDLDMKLQTAVGNRKIANNR